MNEVKVYWVPGCSSCVRVKEFLKDRGVPFEDINVLASERGKADLEMMGARSVPVVSVGSEFAYGASLEQVAELLKISLRTSRLPPQELMDRWLYFLHLALTLANCIPQDLLEHRPVKDRERSVLSLSYHIFQVAKAFLYAIEGRDATELERTENEQLPELRKVEDVYAYGNSVINQLNSWWLSTEHGGFGFPVTTYYGVETAHSLLERSTWHSAQHVRQLHSVLKQLGVLRMPEIPVSAYQGLPMPRGTWE